MNGASSPGRPAARTNVLHVMRPFVRSGWVAAKRRAIEPPSEQPKIVARSAIAASMTAVMSSARSSSVGAFSIGSE
jgi:hypothetical protein